MKQIFIIEQVTPLTQVASQKSTTGTMGMRSIVLREMGGKWANTYAAKVFTPQAEGNYHPGQMVAASLRFRASTNQVTGQIYQDVVVEEIVPISICTPTSNTNEKETYNIPF